MAEKIVGKNKYGEIVELTISPKKYDIKILADDSEKKSKKEKSESGFGSYSNSFNPKKEIAVRGLRALPEGKTEVTLKFFGEKRTFLFVVNELYSKMQEKFDV